MSERVLDASVLLAAVNRETAGIDLTPIVDGALLSAVNLTEALSVVSGLAVEATSRLDQVLPLLKGVVAFNESQARLAGSLRATTKHAGLSLGDRACLALALELNAEVYTADRVWADLRVGCAIHLIR